MSADLPEPYASMSPSDPRRREFTQRRAQTDEAWRTDQLARRNAVADVLSELATAWAHGRRWYQVAVPAMHSRSTLDPDEPTTLIPARDVGVVLAEAEEIGWHVHHIDHVTLLGAETGLAAGVRLQMGTLVAMITLRRP